MSPTENRQITDLKEIVEEQGHQIQALINSVSHVKEGNDRIEVSLIGDKFTENKGLIHKVTKLEERQAAVESTLSIFKAKWAGIVLVIVGLSGLAALIYYATSIIHNLSK